MSERSEYESHFEPEHEAAEVDAELHEHEPHVMVYLFRHDEKTKESTAGERPDDYVVPLTESGKAAAAAAGLQRPSHRAYSKFGYSGRQRARETALLSHAAGTGAMADGLSVESVVDPENEDLFGWQPEPMHQLDFGYGPVGGEYHNTVYEHYLGSKDLLRFTFQQSDAEVRRLGEPDADCYTRTVGNVAEVLRRYFRVEKRWQKIAGDERHAEANNELQRHLGSHQGTLEPFLMKIIENRLGTEGVEKFLSGLKERNKNENGFGFSEGYSADVHPNDDGTYSATVKYLDQVWEVPEAEIEAMVEAKSAFDREIAESIQDKSFTE